MQYAPMSTCCCARSASVRATSFASASARACVRLCAPQPFERGCVRVRVCARASASLCEREQSSLARRVALVCEQLRPKERQCLGQVGAPKCSTE